ncbi:MAG: alpha/beta fold hydrolase [Betaproteobacteria bacterium]|nr:alpha/beta fold hydrolase [Betaproteobacteria bacterium]
MNVPPAKDAGPRDDVVIVHGLWLHGLVFEVLRRRLCRGGFDAHAFSYPSMGRSFGANASALASYVSSLKAGVVHLVGHSLGGLICLRYASENPDPRLSRIVLLGSPVRGSATAARLAKRPFGKWLLGRSPRELAEGVTPHLPPGAEAGVIAGTLGVGLGRLILPLPAPHDGTVAVAETRLPGARDFLLMPVSHTGLVFSAAVAAQVACFLRAGSFGMVGPE